MILLISLFSSISLYSQLNWLFGEGIFYFGVTHHIIRKDDGSGGLDTSEIPIIIQELNKAFAPANIQFYTACDGKNTTRSNDD